MWRPGRRAALAHAVARQPSLQRAWRQRALTHLLAGRAGPRAGHGRARGVGQVRWDDLQQRLEVLLGGPARCSHAQPGAYAHSPTTQSACFTSRIHLWSSCSKARRHTVWSVKPEARPSILVDLSACVAGPCQAHGESRSICRPTCMQALNHPPGLAAAPQLHHHGLPARELLDLAQRAVQAVQALVQALHSATTAT